ncbi:MAG: aspartate aminotransferase family protein [Archangium sp.]
MRVAVTWNDSSVLMRQPTRRMPVMTRGEGVWLFDAEGKKYFDASSGALVVSVGHGNRFVADAIHAQLLKAGYVNGTQFTSDVTEDAAAKLAKIAREELPSVGPLRVAFLCSGSEAVEAAVKFVRQVQVERGHKERVKVVARAPSYHGNTFYALSLSARPAYRVAYGPMLATIPTVKAPTAFTLSPTPTREELAKDLEAVIAREGAHTIAAFIAEAVMGSSGGAAVPPEGHFDDVRRICDANGILFIADEVMCGAGRTGNFYACKTVNAAPDVIVMGKGLGGGAAPVSAVLVREQHMDEIRAGSGYFAHAQTYLQAPFLTGAASAVLDFFEKEKIVAHVQDVGAAFQKKLRARLSKIPYVGAIQGTGLIAGVELVDGDRPFPRAAKVAERLVAHLFERGVVVWPNVGHANGVDGDLFMLGPPLVMTHAEADTLINSLAEALAAFDPKGATK